MSGEEFMLKNANASVIQCLSGEEAISELRKIDDYLRNLSQFDLESRVHSPTATIDDYIASLAGHILDWNRDQIGIIEKFIDKINTNYIDRLRLLKLPPRIFVIVTDGKDENNAAYCRNTDVIVLPHHFVQETNHHRGIFIHELFHIWSRQEINVSVRDELYASIGYHRIPTTCQPNFPVALSAMKITNPDAPLVMQYFINLTRKDGNKTYKCTPILRASHPFNPEYSKNMFAYLVATTIILDDDTFQAKEPLEYLSYDQAKNFRDQIGQNTQYIIHPEEILADNFVLWMTGTNDPNRLKTPEIVQKMNEIIRQSAG